MLLADIFDNSIVRLLIVSGSAAPHVVEDYMLFENLNSIDTLFQVLQVSAIV